VRRRLSRKKVKALRLPGKRFRGTDPELYDIAGFDDVAQNISPNSVSLPELWAASNRYYSGTYVYGKRNLQ
jgi:hypothetical protein